MEDQKEEPRTDILDKIAKNDGSGFESILLFNSFVKSNNGQCGIESLCEYHSNLMALHGFMAGFQYVVVNGEVSSEGLSDLGQVAIALQTIGFGLSLAGTFVSLLAMEYLKGIIDEAPELQVEGILQNFSFFKLSDLCAIGAALLLSVTTNMLLYEQLPVWVCVMVHALTVIFGFRILYFFKTAIVDKQTYGGGRLLYQYREKKKISFAAGGAVEVSK